ncbi:MAG TPA: hypothetical protein VFP74_10490 [Pseudolabrys sp.]|jgi:hypothetical protein|nr:hypothetical protein [Pseudolabrys sp.]
MIKSAPAPRRRFRTAYALTLLTTIIASSALAEEVFPYDQQLMLDVAPIGRVRRVPSITVGSDGTAQVNLWCRTVPARVALNGADVQIEPGPLPESLPQYMSDGQCAPERMAADLDLLSALGQVTGWQKAGGVVTLAGPTPLRFRPSDH